jgi:[acyl-carrier-protein] S-malonyltransferase/trans-AT polyketide synthase/acyltransferase/oxidoreductase domain-containing protein
MAESTALVFPGQGSQRAGMAKDFHDQFAVAREVFAEASEAAGFDVGAMSFQEDERLDLTEYTQPCILTAEIAMLRVLERELGLSADCFGGHSLGEYTALVAAGVLRLADAARLVRRRGALMQEAVPAGEGAMLAVIGERLDLDSLRARIADLEADAANHNSPSQIVVSGKAPDVDRAKERLEADGRRCVPLKVSAPFHSRFMRVVEPKFAAELAKVEVHAADAPKVAANYTGGFHAADAAAVRDALVRQIGGTVRWVDDMKALAARAARIVEVGPGRPLSGFFREIGVTPVAILSWKQAEKTLAKGAGA